MLRIIYFYPLIISNLQQISPKGIPSEKLCPLPTSFNALIINELEEIYNSTIYGGGVKLDIVKALADHLSL